MYYMVLPDSQENYLMSANLKEILPVLTPVLHVSKIHANPLTYILNQRTLVSQPEDSWNNKGLSGVTFVSNTLQPS